MCYTWMFDNVCINLTNRNTSKARVRVENCALNFSLSKTVVEHNRMRYNKKNNIDTSPPLRILSCISSI